MEELILKIFDELPDCCRKHFFDLMINNGHYNPFYVHDVLVNIDKCESPIEKLFYLDFMLGNSSRTFLGEQTRELEMQVPIKCEEGNFRADFVFRNIVIECDGHEFHEKTKEQVAKNNDRDLQLGIAGYDVIHFSGSQIFNDVSGCVYKAIEFIKYKGV